MTLERMDSRVYLARRLIRCTLRVRREFPRNGWWWAARQAWTIQRWSLDILADMRALEDEFAADVMADIASLPEAV